MKKGPRINLVPVKEEDIEWLRETRNKYKEHFFDAGEISKEQQKKWYAKYKDSGGTDHMYIVELKDGTKIGTIAIYDINIENRTAKIGRVLLLDGFRGNGYAEEMIKVAIDVAFNHMRLWKLKVEVHLDNMDAIAIYARAGFKTTTRPIILLERISHDLDASKPVTISELED